MSDDIQLKGKKPETDTAANGMERMSFKAYADNCFSKEIDGLEYKVLINPETVDRSLGVKTAEDKTARSGNSSGKDAGLSPENYSFELMFDGTGIAGPKFKDDALAVEFKKFLEVVYAQTPKGDSKKQANFVTITYCGETFYTKLESMTIKYLLFNSTGYPMRIKASCRFTSVEKEQPEDKNKNKGKSAGKKKVPPPPVTPETPNNMCCCPCSSYEETLISSEKNQSISLMTSSYSDQQMTKASPSSSYMSVAK